MVSQTIHPEVSSQSSLRVFYVFAGHRRKADIREHLENFAFDHQYNLDIHEFDLLRGKEQDVLDIEFWEFLVRLIKDDPPFCIIVTPPCSTYSRARHFYKLSPGPRPIRSRQFPEGFPWLSESNRHKAEEGTALGKKMWELFDIAGDIGSHFLGEFPEDLGLTSTGVPASIWQMEEFFTLISKPGVVTFALFQCEFGAKSSKPTRLISDLIGFEGSVYRGIPMFTAEWKYLGPLPKCCPHPGQHEQLIGMDKSGTWKTSPAAHYPGDLCKFIAKAIVSTWQQHSIASRGMTLPANSVIKPSSESHSTEVTAPKIGDPGEAGQTEQHDLLDFQLDDIPEDTANQCGQELNHTAIVSGCSGPPLMAKYAGRSEEFVDGFGLCSPGRWHPAFRMQKKSLEQINFASAVRKLVDDFCRSNMVTWPSRPSSYP